MTGFICLDKPKDITSFLAVHKVRKIIGEKKAGHTGTLDPMATGVLPIAVGSATRFIELLPSHEKAYIADFKMGTQTDTLDITGSILRSERTSFCTEEIEKTLCSFRGEITQIPPMYSAVLQDGVRLYDLARKGIEVERKSRTVTISKLELLKADEENQVFTIYAACSAGTYIRTLVQDIGTGLGNCAVLTSLRRVSANGFSIEKSMTLEELEAVCLDGRPEQVVCSVEEALSVYPEVSVTQAQAVRFSNGGALDLIRIRSDISEGFYRVYSPEHRFLGVGQADTVQLKAKRIYQG